MFPERVAMTQKATTELGVFLHTINPTLFAMLCISTVWPNKSSVVSDITLLFYLRFFNVLFTTNNNYNEIFAPSSSFNQ